MFSARIGFLGGVTAWYDISNTTILSEIATWSTNGTASTSLSASLSGIYPTTQAYLGGTLHTNGNIYYPPFNATTNSILAFNPTANVVTAISTGLNLGGSSPRFYSGILAKNGKIYFPSLTNGNFLILDPDNGHACQLQNWGLSLGNYDCSVYAQDQNKIYAIGSAAHCLIVDLTANTAVTTTFGGVISGTVSNRYIAGTLSLTNKKIYFAPFNTSNFLIVDPVTDTAVTLGSGLTKNQGCANGKDGNIYGTATTGTSTNRVNVLANTTNALSGSISDGAGAGMGADGNIWVGTFATGSSGGFVNVVAQTTTDSPASLSPAGSRANYVLHPDGNVYAIGQATNGRIYRTDTKGTGVTSPILREIALSAYFNDR